jgi:uncharacterized protein YbjT (DUF2867 family)
MKENILVIGATGKTGSRVVERLTKLGHQVRPGTRSNTPAFDWDDPSTFSHALNGMDRVYVVYYPDLAVPGAKEAISLLTEAAKEQRLRKLVLLSGKGETEAEKCEKIVADSGLDYTLVRASWFNQNFSESFLLDPLLAGEVALPMSEAEIPFVDADDIAEVVTKVLLDDSFNGQTVTVTGPQKLTFKQVVDTIALETKRKINFQAISIDEFSQAMKADGLPDDYVWLFTYLFKEVLGNPENQQVSNDIERVLGRKAISFSEYVQKTAATGLWHQAIPQTL